MIEIPNSEIEITTSRSGGPGGQHVNKTNSRVTLHWDIQNTQVLSQFQKSKCLARLKNKINSEGKLVLHVELFRSQILNKDWAYKRLHELVKEALKEHKKRVKTKPTKGSKARRLDEKKKHGNLKKMRSSKSFE